MRMRQIIRFVLSDRTQLFTDLMNRCTNAIGKWKRTILNCVYGMTPTAFWLIILNCYQFATARIEGL